MGVTNQTAERLSVHQYRGAMAHQFRHPGAVLVESIPRGLASLETDSREESRHVLTFALTI